LTRLSDKWNRLETLMLNPEVDDQDESLLDTMGDMVNYLLMTMMESYIEEMEESRLTIRNEKFNDA